MSKGSKRRPKFITETEEDTKFIQTFGKKLPWWEKRDIDNKPKELIDEISGIKGLGGLPTSSIS
jgi:hypothetical protein